MCMGNLSSKAPRIGGPSETPTEPPRPVADRKTAWARRLGEGARAYEYAWEYFKMGPHRSIEKVAQEFAKNKRPLKRLLAEVAVGEEGGGLRPVD